MSKGLTLKQENILKFLATYIEEIGYPPSIREIGKEFGIKSLRGVTVHLVALERKGYILRENTPRSIRVIDPKFQKTANVTRLPICGTIAAGIPIQATQNIEDFVPVPSEIVKGIENAFVLRIKGDSMTGDGILPRDLVIIKPQVTANHGELIAAMIDGEATIKRLHYAPNVVQLMPSNPSYHPIDFRREDAKIIGKVIGLLRDYTGHAF